jgi:hypothetical protein
MGLQIAKHRFVDGDGDLKGTLAGFVLRSAPKRQAKMLFSARNTNGAIPVVLDQLRRQLKNILLEERPLIAKSVTDVIQAQ